MNGLEAFRACRTPADFYRLQIELENDCAPAELLAMLEPREELPIPARKWIERLEGMMRTGNAPIQPFERVRLAEHVHFFRGTAPEGAPKSLLLCFCGNYHRLMVPLPLFLQHVPAREFDVVVFKDALRCFFLRGVQGYGGNFGELRERLARDLPLERYASLRCVGTSSGGAAGLVAGALFGAERALAFGGIHPSRSAESMSEEVDGCELDPLFARTDASSTRLLALYGAGNEHDREAAATLCRSFGAVAMAVPGVVTHNIFYELFERGELTAFLARNLLGSLAELDAAMAEATPVDRLDSPGPKGRRRRSPVTRMKGAWKRFGGWDQFVYWNRRCAGCLLELIRPFRPK